MGELIDLIRNSFSIDFNIEGSTPLISTGLIDSLHVAKLLVIIEKKYGKVIDTRDIGTDNFDTPQQMLTFLSRL